MRYDLQLPHFPTQESVDTDIDFLYSKAPDLQSLTPLFLLRQYFLLRQLLHFYLQSKFLHLLESRISHQALSLQAYPQSWFLYDNR